MVEHLSGNAYRPYDQLVLRDPKGRTVWTVLSCERAGEGWNITAIRCPRNCPIHRRAGRPPRDQSEIHPIAKIEVWKSGAWVDLESLP